MIITEGNFLKVAMRAYDNSSTHTIEEFKSDLNLIRLIQRQLRKYKIESSCFNIRLMINHFICFTNVFGTKSKFLLNYKIEKQYRKQLNSIFFVFGYSTDKSEVIDEDLAVLLSKEIK